MLIKFFLVLLWRLTDLRQNFFEFQDFHLPCFLRKDFKCKTLVSSSLITFVSLFCRADLTPLSSFLWLGDSLTLTT